MGKSFVMICWNVAVLISESDVKASQFCPTLKTTNFVKKMSNTKKFHFFSVSQFHRREILFPYFLKIIPIFKQKIFKIFNKYSVLLIEKKISKSKQLKSVLSLVLKKFFTLHNFPVLWLLFPVFAKFAAMLTQLFLRWNSFSKCWLLL